MAGDLDGRLFLANPAAMTILGMPVVDVLLPEWPASCRFFRRDMVTPYPSEDLPLTRSLHGETLTELLDEALRVLGSSRPASHVPVGPAVAPGGLAAVQNPS